MKTFKASNFRLFGKDGVEVDFKPITILTGANSSGKSSFVKAMVLVKNYIEAVRKEGLDYPASVQLDFTDPSLKLSGYKEALNNKSGKNGIFSFSMSTTSSWAPFKGFEVEYSFKPSPYSASKGELDSIILSYCKEPVLTLKADNGHLTSLLYHNLKGKLFSAFLAFAKRVLFNQAHKQWEDGSADEGPKGRLLSAKTKEGVDILEWEKYSNLYATGAERLDALSERSEKCLYLAAAIKKFDEMGILLYFPIFDSLKENEGASSKSVVIEQIKDLKAPEDLKKRVIDEFLAAKEDSFVEYYKRLEDESLAGFMGDNDSDSYLMGGDLRGLIRDGQWKFCNNKKDMFPIEKEDSFSCLFQLMHIWQNAITEDTDPYIRRKKVNNILGNDETDSRHKLIVAYFEYLVKTIPGLLFPQSLSFMEVVGSSFTPIQRLYTFDDRSSFVKTIKKFLSLSRTIGQNSMTEEISRQRNEAFEKFQKEGGSISWAMLGNTALVEYNPGCFINKWLGELNIASKLIIEEDADGLGFKLFLQKPGSKRKVNLADEGHGITQLVSILLNIECVIMQGEIDRASGLDAEYRDWEEFAGNTRTLAIEEPEVSLHPAMQTKLALMFEDAYKLGVNFIIETHSEYLVRKTQVLVSQMKDKLKNPFTVYYFTKEGQAYELGYTDSGNFVKQFGPGFLDEARNLALTVFLGES